MILTSSNGVDSLKNCLLQKNNAEMQKKLEVFV